MLPGYLTLRGSFYGMSRNAMRCHDRLRVTMVCHDTASMCVTCCLLRLAVPICANTMHIMVLSWDGTMCYSMLFVVVVCHDILRYWLLLDRMAYFDGMRHTTPDNAISCRAMLCYVALHCYPHLAM